MCFFSATVLGFILKPTQKMDTCLSHNLEHLPFSGCDQSTCKIYVSTVCISTVDYKCGHISSIRRFGGLMVSLFLNTRLTSGVAIVSSSVNVVFRDDVSRGRSSLLLRRRTRPDGNLMRYSRLCMHSMTRPCRSHDLFA